VSEEESCALREQSWRADRRSRRRLWIFPTSSSEPEPTNPAASQPSFPFPPRGASLVSCLLSLVCLCNAVSLPSPHPHTTGRWDSESVSGPDYLLVDSRGGRDRERVCHNQRLIFHSFIVSAATIFSLFARGALALSGRGGAGQSRRERWELLHGGEHVRELDESSRGLAEEIESPKDLSPRKESRIAGLWARE
jgi:hypothetical protein